MDTSLNCTQREWERKRDALTYIYTPQDEETSRINNWKWVRVGFSAKVTERSSCFYDQAGKGSYNDFNLNTTPLSDHTIPFTLKFKDHLRNTEGRRNKTERDCDGEKEGVKLIYDREWGIWLVCMKYKLFQCIRSFLSD